MLSKLHIKNVALIKNLEIEFCDKLNILSGETGAGKSIIVDSLFLLLGNRYDNTILRHNEEVGFVEGVFDITTESAQVLTELGLEIDDETIIVNRKFYASGKNEIRLNGRIITLSMLKAVMSQLVDIYGQNEHQLLVKLSKQLSIVDYYARHKITETVRAIATNYSVFMKIKGQLEDIGSSAEIAEKIEQLHSEVEKISKANIKDDERDDLMDRKKKMLSSEKINYALVEVIEALSSESDDDALHYVDRAQSSIGSITQYSEVYASLYSRLDSVLLELGDILSSATDERERSYYDEEQMNEIEKRLDVINYFVKKYGDTTQLKNILAEKKELLAKLENAEYDKIKLTKELEQTKRTLYDLSIALSDYRKAAARDIAQSIVRELEELGMKNCKFEVNFAPLPSYAECGKYLTANGVDTVEFYFSPNVGQPLKPLKDIISGGEMSRFMLALKVITSAVEQIPTLIFDEIDTGISGAVGLEVAKKLARISRSHQVLCVSHLPQITAMADKNFFIRKLIEDETTITTVQNLSEAETVEEISRLSGGQNISTQAHANAEQMKEWSNTYKNGL